LTQANSKMAPDLHDYTSAPPAALFGLLTAHLPYSLPVLRRLQFSRLRILPEPDPHTFFAHEAGYDLERDWPAGRHPRAFAVAFMDLTRGPEEEMWLYSTLSDGDDERLDKKAEPDAEAVKLAGKLVLTILRRVKGIEAKTDNPNRPLRGWFMLATLNERLRQVLLDLGVQLRKTAAVPEGQDWMFNGKWLWRVGDLREDTWEPQDGQMKWDVVRLQDTDLVRSRTHIPRKGSALPCFPSERGLTSHGADQPRLILTLTLTELG
jgi:hypothetical protein